MVCPPLLDAVARSAADVCCVQQHQQHLSIAVSTRAQADSSHARQFTCHCGIAYTQTNVDAERLYITATDASSSVSWSSTAYSVVVTNTVSAVAHVQ
eukprot:5764-Heterococcus_DN1.PRE.3